MPRLLSHPSSPCVRVQTPYYLPPSRGVLSISSISSSRRPSPAFFITVAVAAVVHPLSETDRDVGGGEALSSSLAIPLSLPPAAGDDVPPVRGDSMFPNDNATARGRDSRVARRHNWRRLHRRLERIRFHLVFPVTGGREERTERTDQQPVSLLFFLVHNDVIQRAPAGGKARRARGSRQTRET